MRNLEKEISDRISNTFSMQPVTRNKDNEDSNKEFTDSEKTLLIKPNEVRLAINKLK